MSWATISLILCIAVSWSEGNNDIFFPRLQFPIRNIQSSIDAETHSSIESKFSSEFHQRYTSDGYVVNLPKLNLPMPPNPFPGFIQGSKVVAVNLCDNGINRISPGSFDSVPNMQYLDLSRNHLAFCDFFDYGSCLSNLITLVIEENQLPGDSLYREIGKAGCFPSVQKLYLRKNHIRRLAFSLKQSFPRLVSLYLSDNELDNCAFIRDIPPCLSNLYVERNHLTSISVGIVQHLRILRADSNYIRSICYKNCDETSIKLLGTSKLEELSLSENKITRIEACAFRDSYSLVSLNLTSNSIQSIHASTFNSLRSLAQLHLDNNILTCMPNLNGNWHLKTLSLRNNQITVIQRTSFSSLKTLQNLYLGGNRIQSIQCDTFADLTWLQQLDLSGNQLESLPIGWMNSLTNLKSLDLRANRLMYVHQLSLTMSLSLTSLYLQNNKFAFSDKGQIQSYCPYAQVYIDSCINTCSQNLILASSSEIATTHVQWEMSSNYTHSEHYSYVL